MATRNLYRFGAIVVLTVCLVGVMIWEQPSSFLESLTGQSWGRLSSSSLLYADLMALADETSSTASNATRRCSNSVQGSETVADSRGYVCRREAVDLTTGCCSSSSSGTRKRFECAGCTSWESCCTHYETCISCCLFPENFVRFGNFYQSSALLQRGAQLRATAAAADEADTNATTTSTKAGTKKAVTTRLSPFDYCAHTCRTKSSVLQSENSYRGSHNHCFGTSKAPLETTSVNSDWAGLTWASK
jgi:hypothetical protein